MICILGCLVTLVVCSIVYAVCLLTHTNSTTHRGPRTDWKTSRRSWEEDPEFSFFHRHN